MAVTVNDILHIDKMEGAIVVAGRKGLNKRVRRIATIEKPFVDHPAYCNEVVQPGDLYVSKLYVFRSQKEKLYEEIEFMRRTEGSGLITHKENLAFFDEEMIRRADEYGIPIIAIDDDYGFTELNYSVIDLIIKDEVAQIHVANLQRILSSDLDEGTIRKHILDIIPDLAGKVQAIYLETPEVISRNIFKTDQSDLLLPLYDGLLYVISSDDEEAIKKKKKAFLSKARHSFAAYHLGISEVHVNLECVKKAILEAVYASAYSRLSEQSCCVYGELGLFALLLDMKNQSSMKSFWQSFYQPLTEYDSDNKLNLTRVLELYVLAGGDYSVIAQELYIHETTVRYRVNKMHELLNYNNSNDFYADAKAAVYMNWIFYDETLNRLA